MNVNLNSLNEIKQQFDDMFDIYITQDNAREVAEAIHTMDERKNDILAILCQAPELDENGNIQADMAAKLNEMNSHVNKIAQQYFSHLSSEPTPPSSIFSSEKSKTISVVGFSRMGCNCWVNSLLSMIIANPTLLEVYEKVADHYEKQYPALKKALVAYYDALEANTPVPAGVTQEVRLVFNALFGKKDPVSGAAVFSADSSAQEDAREALESLIAHAIDVLKITPKSLCPMETTMTFHPIETPQDAPFWEAAKFTQLDANHSFTQKQNQYQISIDVTDQKIIPFEMLLKNYFVNEDQGVEGKYLTSDSKVQKFRRISATCKFVEPPLELILNVNRGAQHANGICYKVKTPVMVPQHLVLPSCATKANQPIPYELDSFVLHTGELGYGHYMCYRKIDGLWIELNDDKTRNVEEKEMNDILQGKKGAGFTSVIHHYNLSEKILPINNSNATSAPLFRVEYQGEGSIGMCGGFNDWKHREAIAVQDGIFFLDISKMERDKEHVCKFVLNQEKWQKPEGDAGHIVFKIDVSGTVTIVNTGSLPYERGSFILNRENFEG